MELRISFYKALYLNCYDSITESLRSLNWTHNYNTRTNAHARHLIFAGVHFLEVQTAKSLVNFKSKLKCHLPMYYNPP